MLFDAGTTNCAESNVTLTYLSIRDGGSFDNSTGATLYFPRDAFIGSHTSSVCTDVRLQQIQHLELGIQLSIRFAYREKGIRQ